MNKIILTTASENCESYTKDFITSLRNLGGYKDKIVIIDYGLSTEFKEWVGDTVTLIPSKFYDQINNKDNKEHRGSIVNYRFTEILDFLLSYEWDNSKLLYEEENNKTLVAHFDSDIWFNGNVNSLFDEIDKTNGCIFSTQRAGDSCVPFYDYSKRLVNKLNINANPLNMSIQDYDDKEYNLLYHLWRSKVRRLINLHSGFINGGFMAGSIESVIDRLNTLILYYGNWGFDHRSHSDKTGRFHMEYFSCDQYILNIICDLDKDIIDNIWNSSIHECDNVKLNNPNKFYSTSNAIYTRQKDGLIPIGIHLNHTNSEIANKWCDDNRFLTQYPRFNKWRPTRI